MHQVDGSGGGGQLLRTALALAALTGEAFEMHDVRSARPAPGLKRQHLACVEAVAAACDAEVEGDELESERLTFRPGGVTGGDYSVDVGTAGSVPLVFDSVLPLGYSLSGDETLRLRVTGGTDVKWAPTAAHHAEVKRHVVGAFGLSYDSRVERVGYYPAGGGEAVLTVRPSETREAHLLERGDPTGVAVFGDASAALSGASVLERAVETVESRLEGLEPGVAVRDRTAYAETASTGMSLCLACEFEHTRAGFDVLGERGKPAEDVADETVDALEAFLATGAAVDRFTADQVMVPLAIGGGEVAVPAVTDHVGTNAEVVRTFGGDLRVEEGDPPVLRSTGGLG